MKGKSSIVLNRCYYNNMRDNPMTRDGSMCKGPVKGVTDCEDCRKVRVSDGRSDVCSGRLFCAEPY